MRRRKAARSRICTKELQPGTSEAEELEALNELIAIYERMGPVIFMRAHETVWENEIILDFRAG